MDLITDLQAFHSLRVTVKNLIPRIIYGGRSDKS